MYVKNNRKQPNNKKNITRYLFDLQSLTSIILDPTKNTLQNHIKKPPRRRFEYF